MKKGDESALTILVSLIVLMIIISQYFIFFVFFPHKIIQPDSQQYIGSEIDLPLMTFVKLNSDLIVSSVKSDDYNNLEKKIDELEFDGCWELKIKDRTFNKNNCDIKNPETTVMNIPDYSNNQIKIILNVNKK